MRLDICDPPHTQPRTCLRRRPVAAMIAAAAVCTPTEGAVRRCTSGGSWRPAAPGDG